MTFGTWGSDDPVRRERALAVGSAGADVHVVEVVSRDPVLAAQFLVARFPARGRCLFVACCARPGDQLLTIVEPALGSARGLELRGPGLWVDLQYLVPDDHVTLGVEAFATGLDDPAEALGRCFGDRVPFGADLEWDTVGPPAPATGIGAAANGYELVGRVHGEILIGPERIEIDALGARRHLWGDVVPWAAPWARRLDARGVRPIPPDEVAAAEVLAVAPAIVRPADLPGAVGAGAVSGMPGPERPGAAGAVSGMPGFRLDRALVRVQDAEGDAGGPGVAWIERSTPC